MCVQKSIDWIYLYVSKKLWLELNFWLSRSEFLDDITREKRNLCLRASTQYPMIMDFQSLHRIMCTYGQKTLKKWSLKCQNVPKLVRLVRFSAQNLAFFKKNLTQFRPCVQWFDLFMYLLNNLIISVICFWKNLPFSVAWPAMLAWPKSISD